MRRLRLSLSVPVPSVELHPIQTVRNTASLGAAVVRDARVNHAKSVVAKAEEKPETEEAPEPTETRRERRVRLSRKDCGIRLADAVVDVAVSHEADGLTVEEASS